MRKLITLPIIIFTIIFSSSIAVQAGINIEGISQKDISSGIISIENNQSDSKAYKLVVSKDNQKYYYTIDNTSSANFPLQMGNGKYEITLMESQEDNSYIGVYSETINLNLTDDKKPYLNSIQLINWDKNMKAVIKAKELTKGIKDTNKKIQAIYTYIVNSMEYDYDKAENVKSGYIPVIDETLTAKKG
ncbi:MAG TPA: transglutaminase domain-containing protein, partial [Clostridia bacterium]|nr:transglutaminase domain-containing protein [Clostridia bacterium]